MVKKVLSVFFLLLAISIRIQAEEISKDKAYEYAKSFFIANDPLITKGAEPKLKLVMEYVGTSTKAVSDPAMYVFNRTDRDGFVIISGESATYPILGYSLTGTFITENIPVNIEQWLIGISYEINYLRSRQVPQSEYFAQQWNTETLDIGDVVIQYQTAKWDQTHPYNLYCPTTNGVKSVTGCTNTAIAIVMKERKWPDCGAGTVPAYTYVYNGQSITISERQLGHNYDWDKMPDILTPGSSQEEIHQVATLMKDCGMISKAEYTDGDTGSDSQNTIRGLKEFMKYSPNAELVFRENHSTSAWHRVLKNELNENGPVFFGGGSGMEGGHAFVLDGYTTKDYYGVNWGWSGMCDGYYLLSALAPSEQGTGGTGDSYSMRQHAIVGLKKAQPNEEVKDEAELHYIYTQTGMSDLMEYDKHRICIGLLADTRNITRDVPFTIYTGVIKNRSNTSTFSGCLQFMLLNDKGEVKELLGGEIKDVEIVPGGFTIEYKEVIINSVIEETDYIALYSKSDTADEWRFVDGEQGCNSRISLVPDSMMIYDDPIILFDDWGNGGDGKISLVSNLSSINEVFNISMGDMICIYGDFIADFAYALFDKDGEFRENVVLDQNYFKDWHFKRAYSSNFPSIECMITLPVNEGDYIAPAYKKAGETKWKQIYGTSDAITRIVLGYITCLTDLAFEYDKVKGQIKVLTNPDVQYKLQDNSGRIVLDGHTSANGVVTIDTSSLSSGDYILSLGRAQEIYSVSLTL